MRPGPAGRYLRFLLLAALVAAASGVVGAPLTRAAAGAAAVPAMIAALVVCWVGAAVGGLPILAAARKGEAAMLTAALGAMALRLAVVVVGAGAVALAGAVPRAPLLLWTGVGYVALLVVETWYAVHEVRGRQPAPTAGRSGGEAPTTERSEAAPAGPARTETR